jgi:hypothetical protein
MIMVKIPISIFSGLQNSNIPKHILPHTSLHRNRLPVLQLQSSFAAIAGNARHFILQFLIKLGLRFQFGF